jgi:hypothetical protein
MPTATVTFVQHYEHGATAPSERDVAVRVGMQGFGSVELDVTDFDWFDPGIVSYRPVYWSTLDDVLRHPQVRGVTFRGPWTD